MVHVTLEEKEHVHVITILQPILISSDCTQVINATSEKDFSDIISSSLSAFALLYIFYNNGSFFLALCVYGISQISLVGISLKNGIKSTKMLVESAHQSLFKGYVSKFLINSVIDIVWMGLTWIVINCISVLFN